MVNGGVEMEGLPRSSVGHVLGLLEILVDEGGVIDAYKLATQEHLSLDEIIEIIDTAKTFGFVTVEHGDVALTELGKKFVLADLHERKKMLHEIIENHPVYRKILSVLRGIATHCIDREEFDKLIGSELTEVEEDVISKNVLDWGRFAEIIWYDADENRVCLEEETEDGEDFQ